MDLISKAGCIGLKLQTKKAGAGGSEVQSQPRKLNETVSKFLKKWHWEDGSEVKSTNCFSTGPVFCSRSPAEWFTTA